MQGRARRNGGTQRVQGERGALALALTLLALDLAVLFRVLLHFDVAITGGIARHAAAARWEAGWYSTRRGKAQLHDVREFPVAIFQCCVIALHNSCYRDTDAAEFD